MRLRTMSIALVCLLLVLPASDAHAQNAASLAPLKNAFERYTGTELVYEAAALNSRRFCGQMPSLSWRQQLRATRLILTEAKKYPRGYLGKLGLKKIALLANCLTSHEDIRQGRVRTRLIGRFNGMWNGRNGVVIVYRRDAQVKRTFHHEVFHQVDATVAGVTRGWKYKRGDDARYVEAVSLRNPYPALPLSRKQLQSLQRRAGAKTLQDFATRYARTSHTEDQAETAAFLMTNLAGALTQAARRPRLAGSQKILHVLREYRASLVDGPSGDWFASIALGQRPVLVRRRLPRNPNTKGRSPGLRRDHIPPPIVRRERRDRPTIRPTKRPRVVTRRGPQKVLVELRRLLKTPRALNATETRRIRQLLSKLGTISSRQPGLRASALYTARMLTYRLMFDTVRPSGQYRVPGSSDASGINWTLRRTLAGLGRDAARLSQIWRRMRGESTTFATGLLQNLRVLSGYHTYVASRWQVTPGTRRAFANAVREILAHLPAAYASQMARVKGLSDTQLLEALRTWARSGS